MVAVNMKITTFFFAAPHQIGGSENYHCCTEIVRATFCGRSDGINIENGTVKINDNRVYTRPFHRNTIVTVLITLRGLIGENDSR